MRKYSQPEFTNQKDIKECFMAVIDISKFLYTLYR